MCFGHICFRKNYDYENISCSNGGNAHRVGGISDRRICPEPSDNDLFIDKAVFVVDKTIIFIDKAVFILSKTILIVGKTVFILDKAQFSREFIGFTANFIIRQPVNRTADFSFKTVVFGDKQKQFRIAGQKNRNVLNETEFDHFKP